MGRLPRTRHFQTQLDQAVFKLNGIVVLVHQLPNLKRILFKKRSIFHLPYAEYRKAVLIFNNALLKTDFILEIVQFYSFQLQRDSPCTY